MKRFLFALSIFFTYSTILAQSYNDGCMRVRIVATQAYCEEYEDPFANDESNWQWWFADAGNYDGAGWVGGQCLAQGGFYMIGWWNHTDFTVYDRTYGTAGPNAALVPQTYSLRGHYEGDDCGSSCDYCTSNPFDNDDYRYDEVVSSGINYRFSAPNQDNYFTRQTSWHGGSDYGGQFYVNYTSPRPTVTSNINQICAGTTTNVTFNFAGAIFGGSYVMVDASDNSVDYSGTSASATLALNTTKTYHVYTSNNGVRSLCYSTIVVNTYSCNTNYNCLSATMNGGTVAAYSTNGPRAGGLNYETNYFISAFPANSYITDIDVPVTGGYSNTLMEVGYNNTTTSTSVVSLPTNFVNLLANVTYDLWWDNPTSTGNSAGNSELEVCACKTANYGIATVNGSAAGITICQTDPYNITLAHNGSVNSFSGNGYGDQLRWFSGSCGGTYLGSGLSISVPSPTTTTTYYASFYVNGVPCRGTNTYCESVTVTVDAPSVGGTVAPATQTICVSTAPTTLTLSGHTSTVVGWQYLDNNTGNWVVASGSGSSTNLSLIPYASIPGTHIFRALVYNGTCDTVPSTTSELIVNPNPVAGAISAIQTSVCSDSAYVLNANGYAGNVQWQESTVNGTTGFVNISGANSPSYGNTITNTGSSVINRWYRIVVTNPPCATSVVSNVIQISVYPVTNPGTLTATKDSICQGDDAGTLSLNSYIGSVTGWLSSYNGGALTPILNTNNTYMPGTLNTAGTYDYYAIVQSGSCNPDTTAAYRITVLPSLVVSITGATEVCAGSSITLTATVSGGSGTYSYQWQRNGANVGTNSSTYTTSTTLTPNNYNYTVIVTSAQCMTTSAVHAVTVNPQPTISNVTTQNLNCYGVNIGSINITALADSFSIDSGISFTTSNTFSSLPAGSYNVVVKNDFGCIKAYSGNPVIITQPDSTTINFNITEPHCATSNDGSVTVMASGGTPGYEYALNGGSYQSGSTFNNLAPGTYTFSVRDNNNCVYLKDTTLTAQYTFDVVIDSFKNVSCPGSADGYVQLGTIGGVAPYQFSTDNAIFTPDSVFSGLVAGSYTFYAEDMNGCTDVVSANIVETPPVQISLDSVNQITCYNANDGAIFVSVSGSTPPYTYEWRLNGAVVSNNEDISGLAPGSYNLTVNTTASCLATLAVTLVTPDSLIATVTNTEDASCNGATDGSVSVSVTGGTPSYTYSWLDGTSTQVATIQNLSNVGADSYSLTVTDANGCTATASATVNEPAALSVVTVTSNPSCSNSNDGSITVNVTGGTAAYTYSLNNVAAQSSNVFTNLSAGTYTIDVEDANGCTATGNAILTDQYTLTLAVASQTNVSCSGNNDGTVTLQVTGGSGTINYTVNGTNTQTSNVFTGLAAGLYTFEATDANGCSASVSTTITSNPPVVLTLDSTENVSCNGQTTGAVYVHATGGATPYSYSLNGGAGQVTGMFTGLAAGSYNVVVTDNAGCTASVSTSLTEPSAFTATVTNTEDASCNGATDGNVSVSVTGGTPSYTYSWLDGTSTQVATTQNLSNVGADSYSLTVTDANGCTATASATVNEPAALSVVTVTSDPSCSNSNDGSITVNVTGGTAAYTYSLNNGAAQSSNVFTYLSAGTYTIDVEDANGCNATGNAILTDQYTMTLAVASQTNVSCSGNNDGTVTLQVTGGSGTINYTVNGTNTQTSNVFTGLAAGLYTFEATDANGCSASVSTTITSNPPVVLTLDSTENVSCNGQTTGAVYVHATGGATPYSYSLNGGAGQATGMFTGLAAGSYNVVVTDNAGCTASVSASLTEPSAFTATVTNTEDASCNGATDGSVSVSVTGGTPSYTYSWLDGTSTQVATTQNLSNVGADSYSLTVTDANGCTATASATVNEPAALSVVTVTSNPSCSNSNDGSITVNVTGGTAGYTYSLNNGAAQSSNVFTNLSAGTYTIDVEDANGCNATGNAILTDQYTLTLAVASQTNVSCSGNNDGTVTLQVTGGSGTINYTVNGTNPQTSNVFTGLAAGLYTFEATDANGCSASVSATITENPPLTLSLDSITDVNCNGQSSGAIYVHAAGGSTPYSYSLNGGATQTSGAFTSLSAGTYTVMVVDNNGCSQSLSATVSQPGILSLVIADYSDINCTNDSSGHVDVSVAGGVPPYSFSWSNGATTEDIYNLPVGTYTITVTDANGCVQTISQTIANPSPLTASISTTDEMCFGDNMGTATVTASGGTAPYTYLWNNFATTQTISGLSTGVVSVMVTDKNGCQIVVSDTVFGPSAALEIQLDRLSHVSCYGGNDGEILTSIFGGTAPYTVSWSPNVSNTQNADSLYAGVYTLTVTDANGCQTFSTFVVQQPSQIVSSVSVTNPSCYGQETGMALVGASGGTPPFIYEWNTNPVQTGALANNLAGDTSYIVQITDNNGCVVYDTAVTVNPAQMTVSTTERGVTCVSSVNGEVAVQVLGGQAPYTYQLNGFMQTDSVFDNLAVGTYVVFVIDNNNCSASTQFDIISLPTLEIDLQGAGINNIYYSDELQIVRGEEVSLLVDLINQGVGVQSVHWLPNSGPFAVDTTCTNPPCLNASITPDTYVQVVVNVIDTNGCTVYDTLNINVSQEPLFFMPTAFSPNGDCLNDNFEINILGATNLDVRVYNRWGEQLFHNESQENGLSNPDDIIDECMGGSINPRNAWDGTFNGEPMPIGTYVYQIDATMFDGTIETISGTITIIR